MCVELNNKKNHISIVPLHEALEIKFKGATNSVCLRRIVVQSYGVRFRSVWVRFRAAPLVVNRLVGVM